MSAPYYADEWVTLWHGDCREITNWLTADVLVTDPPYGISWSVSDYNGGTAHNGIVNDSDTSLRDLVLGQMLPRPCVVFGSPMQPPPAHNRATLVWAKPPDAGIFGTFAGYRRDWEAVYLLGTWPTTGANRSSILRSGAGGLATYVRRGHPHGKPLDVMEMLISVCPAGIVADPFVGSGSTLVAARAQGRRAIGVEIEERVLRDRCQAARPGRPRLRECVVSASQTFVFCIDCWCLDYGVSDKNGVYTRDSSASNHWDHAVHVFGAPDNYSPPIRRVLSALHAGAPISDGAADLFSLALAVEAVQPTNGIRPNGERARESETFVPGMHPSLVSPSRGKRAAVASQDVLDLGAVS